MFMNTITIHIPCFNQLITIVSSLFLYLFITWIGFRNGKNQFPNEMNEIKKIWIKITFYFVFCLFLSYIGFLETFKFPPRMPLLSFSITLISLYMILRSPLYELIKYFGKENLVLFQVWRFIPESIIFINVFTGIQPSIMTFTGNNFDILVPISAPMIYLLFRYKFINANWILVWNVVALLGLIHTLSVGVLSAPYPFQLYDVYPSNAIVGYFPMTLIPLFFVPLAIISHVLGILLSIKNETTESK
ncbi:putative membrane protein [Leptospira yanagawae serovar Saopaulo str. Sao Paulo = ATCC 700523]|uniref:Putative membrane protein n=2 Tax=Leptospira yanagawae TaxID=293069 RepID=A0A5E8HBG2_9LEPT|nr:putative membrane protein [Leptospira yanagawae serovar Saopaulo str. Sao Paulo = ATCC 700523]